MSDTRHESTDLRLETKELRLGISLNLEMPFD